PLGASKKKAHAELPSLILLDLNMPRKDGREVLDEIKKNKTLRKIPVIVLTTSKADTDISHAYDLGVNSYIQKPVRFNEFVEVVKVLSNYWFNIVKLPD
ncbi:MAG: response regulator, partial [Nitrospinae bacterium]|nr:response regulator [Nitrospinota bacterium]